MDYFQSQTGQKRKQTAVLHAELQKRLASGTQRESIEKLVTKQNTQIKARQSQLEKNFGEWLHELRLGFSLLFLGYGSKKAVLDNFGAKACLDGAVLAVNCWARQINLRSLLLKVIGVLRNRSSAVSTSRATGDARALAKTISSGPSEQILYLILHGIDSPALRAAECQAVLANIASLPFIRLVASVDHINAPLLWDKKAAASFKWLFHDLTTFQPCYLETARCHPLLVSSRVETQKQGAALVLNTLVPRARKVFQLLADHQLNLPETGGITLHELYQICRNRFLVANELSLRHHISEFKDHALVHTRKSAEGAELLYIPLAEDALIYVLETLGSAAGGGTDVEPGASE